MNLKRLMKRKALKEQAQEMESIIRNGGMANKKLNMEISYYQKKIEGLQSQLKVANDVIASLAITDIRNHNFTCYENKKQIAIPFSFLLEVSKKYKIVTKSTDDTLVIEPVEIKEVITEEKSEGVEGDEAEGKDKDGSEDEANGGNEDKRDCIGEELDQGRGRIHEGDGSEICENE